MIKSCPLSAFIFHLSTFIFPTFPFHARRAASPQPSGSQERSQEGSKKSSERILMLLSETPEMTIAELAANIGISDRAIKKQIAKLKNQGQLTRIGSTKSGQWKVIEESSDA